jgi:L-iditol 2-dehydrogenase
MKASVLVSMQKIELREVEIPRLAADEVLVRISAVGVCGSDTHFYAEGHIGDMVVRESLILGHEAAGCIVDAGREVPRERIGQRVSIEPQRPCRTCVYCKRGQYNLCIDMRFYAAPPVDGAFAEYASIPADFAHPVPDTMSDEASALIEPLSVAIATCRKARITAGSRVLVAGAGPIGLLVSRVARIFGATEVIVSDPSEYRRRFALNGWATAANDPITEPSAVTSPLVDAFVDASGAPTAINQGVHAVRPGGKVVLVGMGAEEVELPVSLIQNREIELTGVFRYTDTWPLAIELAASGSVALDQLVTHRFGLDDVEAALKHAGRNPEAVKSVVIP